MMPPLDTVGEIQIADQELRFITVVDDSASTGGYLIYRANNSSMYGAYDEWAENELRVQQYLADFGSSIVWGVSGR